MTEEKTTSKQCRIQNNQNMRSANIYKDTLKGFSEKSKPNHWCFQQ